jgi:hypothetical protein
MESGFLTGSFFLERFFVSLMFGAQSLGLGARKGMPDLRAAFSLEHPRIQCNGSASQGGDETYTNTKSLGKMPWVAIEKIGKKIPIYEKINSLHGWMVSLFGAAEKAPIS